jgi:hypothetical protein
MIKYSLACKKGHTFEGWFASSDAFDKQAKRKLVACATCGSTEVQKALMAPRIGGTRQNKQASEVAPKKGRRGAVPAVVPATDLAPLMATELPEAQKQLLEAMRQLRKEVEANADYVGSNFAEEARKIHHDEVPARGIYGETTPEEAKALVEEGVSVYPLPLLPEDKN